MIVPQAFIPTSYSTTDSFGKIGDVTAPIPTTLACPWGPFKKYVYSKEGKGFQNSIKMYESIHEGREVPQNMRTLT